MSDPILPPPSASSPQAVQPEAMTPQEIEQGKVLAALGYPIGIIAIVVFFVRNNRFALFHAKQVVALVLIQLALMIPFMVLFCILSAAVGATGSAAHNGGAAAAGGGIAMMIGCLFWIVSMAVGVGSLVLVIIGLINAIQGQAKPLPLIGGFAEKWFRNVRVKA